MKTDVTEVAKKKLSGNIVLIKSGVFHYLIKKLFYSFKV